MSEAQGKRVDISVGLLRYLVGNSLQAPLSVGGSECHRGSLGVEAVRERASRARLY